MNRRETVLALVTLATSAGPPAAFAQTPTRMPTLGFFSFGAAPAAGGFDRTPIASALEAKGWVEGKNLKIERAYADGSRERLARLAQELVGKKVDLIYAQGPDPAVAAIRATQSIPIVFFGLTFPIEFGLVDSYARPGRNATGVAWSAGVELYEKLLEQIKEALPAVTRVAYLRPGPRGGPETGWWFNALQNLMATAASRGMELRAFNVSLPEDFEPAFDAIKAWRPQALFVHQTPLLFAARQQIVDFANAHRVPSFFDSRYFVEAGGLFSYGPDLSQLFALSVGPVDRILRGAHPADIPVQMPTHYELFINRKTANSLGVKIPQTILLRADRVID